MSVWNAYPSNYREDEVRTILKAIQAGECVSIIGLSGAGKSNLMGFLANRVDQGPKFVLVDCNELPAPDLPGLLTAIIESLGGESPVQPVLRAAIRQASAFLEDHPQVVCLLFDRFDLFNADTPATHAVTSSLRSLRDQFKYHLTYVTATRKPLEPASELAELFSGHMLWLGPLNRADALWSIGQFASRHGMDWDGETMDRIYNLSKGYPSMLRAICQACVSGVPLEIDALREAPAVRRRLDEFWSDSPSPDSIRLARLDHHPLLDPGLPPLIDAASLTVTEQRLLEYFTAHPGQVCIKESLIQAVWPDEKVAEGLRDDSLTQLIHRLREKIDTGGIKHIQTIPGRGYRYRE